MTVLAIVKSEEIILVICRVCVFHGGMDNSYNRRILRRDISTDGERR